MNIEGLIEKIDNTHIDRFKDKYLKELFDHFGLENDSENILRIASLYSSHPSVRKWNKKDKCKNIIKTIKGFLDENEQTFGRENKVKTSIELYNYLIQHFWFVALHDKFHKIVDEKAIEFTKETDFPELVSIVQRWIDNYSINASRCKVCETYRHPDELETIGVCQEKCCVYKICKNNSHIFNCRT